MRLPFRSKLVSIIVIILAIAFLSDVATYINAIFYRNFYWMFP
jgi:uncharacterized membrane protein YqhA